uniref:Uncharacterized protein n=1 Tax=Anguilla anguilla TaxID=7936 RepID=A0A0E9Q8W6_ANGAN
MFCTFNKYCKQKNYNIPGFQFRFLVCFALSLLSGRA